MRRVFKAILIVAALFLVTRYFPVYYNASQFNDYVKQAPQHKRVSSQLQQALLDKAAVYFLPVKPVDIQIKADGTLIRVKVDYRVPVNLFVFKHELSFHASGAGLQARN